MTNTAMTMADALFRNAIGYDPLQRFTEMVATTNYPPHNIEKITEDQYRLTLAIAGFTKEDIKMSLHKGILTIAGSKSYSQATDTATEFLYQGIAFRDFSRQFKLGENIEVTNAALTDGLLVIDLMRIVPDDQKARVILIQ